mmetsp:Transcript_17439/g.24249  ORF Transcript_17439/g.24249 Transcript_17439/m.24249 type:complete len:271 (+) Transcript_17439:1542-2354(+)
MLFTSNMIIQNWAFGVMKGIEISQMIVGGILTRFQSTRIFPSVLRVLSFVDIRVNLISELFQLSNLGGLESSTFRNIVIQQTKLKLGLWGVINRFTGFQISLFLSNPSLNLTERTIMLLVLTAELVFVELAGQMVIQNRLLSIMKLTQGLETGIEVVFPVIKFFWGFKSPRRKFALIFRIPNLLTNRLQGLDMRSIVTLALFVVLAQESRLELGFGSVINHFSGVQVSFLFVHPLADLSVALLVASSLDTDISPISFASQVIIKNSSLLL